MAETEVYRIQPLVNKCYEHAEYTRSEGRYPNERYFTNIPPRYVGEFIRSKRGGWGDGGWQTDYFRDLNGNEVAINYSYEGRTSFREVPCPQPPPLPREHLEAIQNTRRTPPKLQNLAFYQLPTQTVSGLRQDNVLGGKRVKYNKKTRKNKKTNKRKYRKSRKTNKNL
jgi:hypothetical protein